MTSARTSRLTSSRADELEVAVDAVRVGERLQQARAQQTAAEAARRSHGGQCYRLLQSVHDCSQSTLTGQHLDRYTSVTLSHCDRAHRTPEIATRQERKQLTRQALLDAALELLEEQSFSSLSLRQVTRAAGIVPTAFYRHFDDMEELGLVLIDESFRTLRTMIRAARADPRTTVA